MPKPVKKISLDQIMAERQFSRRSSGDGLVKIFKAPTSWNEEARSARFTMTAEVVDRYGDIVVTKGGDVSEFEKNPVALWAHDNRDFPIGMWSDIKTINGSPKRMEGTVNLSEEGTTDECDTVVKLLSQGMVRACSIGFMPKAWESIKDEKDRWTGYRFLEWELLECSVCSIPANPAALVKAAGGNEGLALQAIELVLDTYARTPEGLIVPRNVYEQAYSVVKDKDVTVHEVRAVDEEDEDAPAPELTHLDIEAAVSRGVEKAADGIMTKLAALFGKKIETPKKDDDDGDDDEPEVPEPEEEEEKSAGDDEDGETEEEFQARIAAAKEDELADEAEETALRARVAEVA